MSNMACRTLFLRRVVFSTCSARTGVPSEWNTVAKAASMIFRRAAFSTTATDQLVPRAAASSHHNRNKPRRSKQNRRKNHNDNKALYAAHKKLMTQIVQNTANVDTKVCANLMKEWALRGRADMALQLWQQLLKFNLTNGPMLVQMLKAINKSKLVRDKGPQAEICVEQALKQWKAKSASPSHLLNLAAYNSIMSAWSKTTLTRRQENVGQEAEKWLHQLRRDGLQPNVVSYACLIHAYRNSAQDAIRLFHELQTTTNIQPNVVVYTSVMRALADDTSPERSEELLKEMQSRGVHPNVQTFSTCMASWANTGNFERVERLMQDMVRLNVKPDTAVYNVLLHALSKSNDYPNAAERATRIVQQEMRPCQPDLTTYNTWINVLNKHMEQSQHQAEAILRGMIDQWRNKSSNVKPDALTYSAVLQAWAKSHAPDAPERCEALLKHMDTSPTTQCFDALLDAWARSSRGATRVLEILAYMKQQSPDLQPTARTYNAVLLALARAGQPAQAEAVLQNMTCEPNTVCFTTVISAWAQQGEADRALELLREMQQSACTPNIYTYSAVMTAFAKQGKVDKVKELLEEAERVFEKTGNADMKPNIVSFNVLLEALANQETTEAALEAQDLVLGAQDADVVSYTTALSAWANLGEGQLAQDLLEEMEKRGHLPNVITYTNVITAWTKSTSQDKAQRVQQLSDRMQMKHGLEPNNVTYTQAVFANIESDTNKAVQLLERMVRNLVDSGNDDKPPMIVFQRLHKALLERNDADSARQVLELQERVHRQ